MQAMRKMVTTTMKQAALGVLLTAMVGCGGKAPDAPTPTPTPASTPTRVLVLVGSLNFPATAIGTTASAPLTVRNDGNSTLNITGMTLNGPQGSIGFAASPTTATVAAGASMTVMFTFTPKQPISYGGTLTMASDKTSGTNTASLTGSGFASGPLWTNSGKGDNVFTIPESVGKVHVRGHFVDTGGSSNFIARLNGGSFINEILRTADYDGTLSVTGGGQINITSSASIQWTFTEVR